MIYMNLNQCFLTKNACYLAGKKITVKGIMVHSTGANNPNLRRYVAPDDGKLGKNPNGNHWNKQGLNVCVHAFIGKLADGSVATYQTLPWNARGWHCGSGKNGSGNNSHIGFEICEGDLSDKPYFTAVYRETVELCAYLCKEFSLDPLADGVLICHSEGNKRGIASAHADVMHWFPKHGKSMDSLRADVKALLQSASASTANDKGEQEMNVYKRLEDVPEWYRPTIRKLMELGGLAGTAAGASARLEDKVIDVDETYCRVMTSLNAMGKLG